MFFGFFRRYRIKKRTRLFWSLMRQGESHSALEHYKKYLVPYEHEVSAHARAAFYLHCWFDQNSEESFKALEQLAANAASGSQIVAAYQAIRRFRWERNLTIALARRTDSLEVNAPPPTDCTVSNEFGHLAMAIFEAYHAKPGDATTAITIQRLLAQNGISEGQIGQTRQYLRLWAFAALNAYPEIFRDEALKTSLKQQPHWQTSFYQWGRFALSEQNIQGALEALEESKKSLEPQEVSELTLKWTLDAMASGYLDAVWAWLSDPMVGATIESAQKSEWLVPFCTGLTHLHKGHFTQGREILTALCEKSPSNGVQTQAKFLCGLSLFAETKDWTPSLVNGPGDVL